MCVVDHTTYVHESGRQETIEKRRLCHKAVGQHPCLYAEYKDRGLVRTIERRPSPGRKAASDPTIPTRDNQQRRFFPMSRTNRRASTKKPSESASPVDSAASSSPVPPIYKEIRPEAPMPPQGRTYPSARRATGLSPVSPLGLDRVVMPDGTASYSRPPSLDIPRAEFKERTPRPRQDAYFETGAASQNENAPKPRPGTRRVSFKDRRPSISVDVDVAQGYASSGGISSPGLSNITRLDLGDKGKGRARIDSSLDDEARQAQLERERLAGTDDRQRARLSRDAEEAARKRADQVHREREEASRERRGRKDREIRRAAEALEGRGQSPYDDDMQRRVDAELAQVARERQEAERRKRESGESSPMSVRSYTYPPGSPVMSRPLPSARRPGPVVVHNYRPTSGGSISQRGAAVIDRYARAASRESQQLEEAMAYMDLDRGLAADVDDFADEGDIGRREIRRSRPNREERRENRDYFE